MRWRFGSFLAVVALPYALSNAQVLYEYASTEPMPHSRVKDSYAIYAQLLFGSDVPPAGTPQVPLLLREDTTSQRLSLACTATDSSDLNPHTAIVPPESRTAEFAEVLADFDAHCHESYLLQAKRFHNQRSVQLLNENDQTRFSLQIAGPPLTPARETLDILHPPPLPPDPFHGARSLHGVSAVYFNRRHSLAMTEVRFFCGELCAKMEWIPMERTATGWRQLPWRHAILQS